MNILPGCFCWGKSSATKYVKKQSILFRATWDLSRLFAFSSGENEPLNWYIQGLYMLQLSIRMLLPPNLNALQAELISQFFMTTSTQSNPAIQSSPVINLQSVNSIFLQDLVWRASWPPSTVNLQNVIFSDWKIACVQLPVSFTV